LDPNETPIEEPVKEDPEPPRKRPFKLNAKWIVFFIWLALMAWGFNKIRPLITMFLEPEAGSIAISPKADRATGKTPAAPKNRSQTFEHKLKHETLESPLTPGHDHSQ